MIQAKSPVDNGGSAAPSAATPPYPPTEAAPSRLGARSRLVGRGRELTALAAALAESRLVTVVGTAGVGKTRLALEYAYAQARAPGGVIVEDATSGLADLAAAASAGRDGAGSGPVVLILDACEGVVEHAAARLAELLSGAPLDVAALLLAGWPDERVLHHAGTSRVYTAIAQLRREGLRDVLLRRDEGYLLDPNVAISRAAD